MTNTKKDLFRSVYKTSEEGILLLDHQGTILQANPICHHIFGYPQGELLRKNVAILFSDVFKTELLNGLKHSENLLLNRKAEEEIAIPGFRKDGSSVSIRLRVDTDPQNEPSVATLFLKDLTSSHKKNGIKKNLSDKTNKRIPQKITAHSQGTASRITQRHSGKTTSDYLRNIKSNALEVAGICMFIVDIKDPGLPIIYCNNAFTKLTGFKNEEVYGRNCWFMQNRDHDRDQIDRLNEALLKGKTHTEILHTYRKDGSRFWNEITFSPTLNSEGTTSHFIGVYKDISEQKREEYFKDQIRDILEMIATNEPLSLIATSIAVTIDSYYVDCASSILLLDKASNTLQNLASPKLPQTYTEYIEKGVLGSKFRTKTKAEVLRKEIIIADLANQKLWIDDNDLATKYGLRSCCTFPIKSAKNGVMGVLAIYRKYPGKPLEEDKNVFLDMTYLAGVAIEQHHNTLVLQDIQRKLEKYTGELEKMIHERTQEVSSTVEELAASKLHLEEQILISNKAKNEALAGKALTAAIAKNFPNGIIAVISDTFEILLAEGEALAELGLKKYMFEGMNISEILAFSENRKSKLKKNITRTLAGEHVYFEVNYNHNYFSVNTAPLYDENGKVTRALIVYSDITQQKRTEFNMQIALKKEQELNELKSRFIAMASHEFRTPLSVILSSAILIGKQNDLGSPLESQKYVHKIVKNVNNLEMILNDFLSLSKVDEGNININLEYFDLVRFTRSLIDEIKVSIKKGQTIQLEMSEKIIPIQLDLKLMRHILTNLLSNATKYSPENSNIVVKIFLEPDRVILEIIDSGMGIPEEDQSHLFERFFRAKNAINIEGTGIGLNIVKHYVELLQGTIDFKSKLDQGSTFRIEFPNSIH